MAPDSSKHESSFPGLVYPSFRSGNLWDTNQWLVGKNLDDGAEGLWRVHDNLYDLSSFIDKHPGGREWLALTKGTDITEAFECHHISKYPEELLKKFMVRQAVTKRNSPFTFEENGFYRTLKKRIQEELKNVPEAVDSSSKRLIEFFAFGIFACSIMMCRVDWIWAKLALGVLAGLFIAWTAVCGHNFVHMKNNWRMYLFNLSTMSLREWRVIHALSHHMYPNTLMDLEISSFEPFFQWLPDVSKKTVMRFGPWLYFLLPYTFSFSGLLVKRLIRIFLGKSVMKIQPEDFLFLSVPLAMYILGDCSFGVALFYWVGVIHAASCIFTFIAANAAHHHPDIFHEGDDPHEDTDWGVHQLYSLMDRKDITGSHFRVMTAFGDHGLHHLFPTLDHAALPYLYPALWAVCEEFGTDLRMSSSLDMFLGQFRQLARNKPNKKNI